MESLLKSFDLPYTDFANMVHDSRGIVAGGAALYAYLHPTGTGPNFTGDIDVWIQTENQVSKSSFAPKGDIIAATTNSMTEYAWTSFLDKYGYKYKDGFADNSYSVDRFSNIIRRVLSFENTKGKKVQVILTFAPVSDVCKTFDFSVCATWWNGCGSVKTLDPENTSRRYIYPLIDKTAFTKREIDRLEKYRKRGFTVFDSKPTDATSATW